MKDKIIEITKKTFSVPLNSMYWENKEDKHRFLESFAEEIEQLLTHDKPEPKNATYLHKSKICKNIINSIRDYIIDEDLISEIETDLTWLSEFDSIHARHNRQTDKPEPDNECSSVKSKDGKHLTASNDPDDTSCALCGHHVGKPEPDNTAIDCGYDFEFEEEPGKMDAEEFFKELYGHSYNVQFDSIEMIKFATQYANHIKGKEQ